MFTIADSLKELRERTERANRLNNDAEKLMKAKRFEDIDMDVLLSMRVWEAGKAAILAEIERGLHEALKIPEPSPPSDGWEPIDNCPQAVALFFDEGDEDALTPHAIFCNQYVADSFLKIHDRLPEDEKWGEPHLHAVRGLTAEVWNSMREVVQDEPTAQPGG